MPERDSKFQGGYPAVITSEGNSAVCYFPDGSACRYPLSASALLQKWCLLNGSSMQGRIDSFKMLTGARRKAGVLVNEISGPLYFPLYGFTNPRETWISSMYLKSYAEESVGTKLTFFGGFTYQTDCGYRLIQHQAERCSRFLKALEKPALDLLGAGDIAGFLEAEIA